MPSSGFNSGAYPGNCSRCSRLAAPQEVLDGLAAMNGRAIPDDQQLAADLAQQHAQEAHDIGRAVGLLLGLHEQAPRRHDAADRREMVMGERHLQEGVCPRGAQVPTARGSK